MVKEKLLVHISDDYKTTYCGEQVKLTDVWDGLKKTCTDCLHIESEKNLYSRQTDKWDF